MLYADKINAVSKNRLVYRTVYLHLQGYAVIKVTDMKEITDSLLTLCYLIS